MLSWPSPRNNLLACDSLWEKTNYSLLFVSHSYFSVSVHGNISHVHTGSINWTEWVIKQARNKRYKVGSIRSGEIEVLRGVKWEAYMIIFYYICICIKFLRLKVIIQTIYINYQNKKWKMCTHLNKPFNFLQVISYIYPVGLCFRETYADTAVRRHKTKLFGGGCYCLTE